MARSHTKHQSPDPFCKGAGDFIQAFRIVRLIIIAQGALGDFLLAVPSLRASYLHPDLRLDFWTLEPCGIGCHSLFGRLIADGPNHALFP